MRSASSTPVVGRAALEQLLRPLVGEVEPRLHVDDRLAHDAEAEVAGLDDARVHRAHRDLVDALAADLPEREGRPSSWKSRGDGVFPEGMVVARARTRGGRAGADRDGPRARCRTGRASRARTVTPDSGAWPATGSRVCSADRHGVAWTNQSSRPWREQVVHRERSAVAAAVGAHHQDQLGPELARQPPRAARGTPPPPSCSAAPARRARRTPRRPGPRTSGPERAGGASRASVIAVPTSVGDLPEERSPTGAGTERSPRAASARRRTGRAGRATTASPRRRPRRRGGRPVQHPVDGGAARRRRPPQEQHEHHAHQPGPPGREARPAGGPTPRRRGRTAAGPAGPGRRPGTARPSRHRPQQTRDARHSAVLKAVQDASGEQEHRRLRQRVVETMQHRRDDAPAARAPARRTRGPCARCSSRRACACSFAGSQAEGRDRERQDAERRRGAGREGGADGER